MAERGGADPRAFAWKALEAIEAGAFSDVVVGEGLDAGGLRGPDRALATRLVYGTVAWQGYLDHLLGALAHRPLSTMPARLRCLLRLGLYQVCKLDRVPDFAAVDSAVTLGKRRIPRAAGFVNAILRRAAAEWRDIPLPAPETDLAGHLAVRHSHPRWLVERWLAELGREECEALLAANNGVAPTVLRAVRIQIDRATVRARWAEAGVVAQETLYAPDGLVLAGSAATRGLPGYDRGWIALQGEASQLVGELVGARAGERVLDLCAAPGGKACQLADRMRNEGQVVALDPSAAGITRLRQEAARQGLTIIDAHVGDGTAAAFSVGSEPFDRVLVDAPCTGFGTLRQHPEIRWRRSPADVAANAALQRRLLQRAARHVRPGGVLVYATCTVGREENEAVVESLLAAGEFHRVPAADHLPASAAALVDGDGYLRTWPHRHGLDGFFAARLQRVEPERRLPG